MRMPEDIRELLRKSKTPHVQAEAAIDNENFLMGLAELRAEMELVQVVIEWLETRQ